MDLRKTEGCNIYGIDCVMLPNFPWIQATSGYESMRDVLVLLMAFRPDRSPAPIGTGFIVASQGRRALVLSAAHNFYEGVKKAQQPHPSFHASALPEFLPGFEQIDVDRRKLRVVYVVGSRVEVCVIEAVVWDRKADIALLSVSCQDESSDFSFDKALQLRQLAPSVGDEVCMLGYADMTVEKFVRIDQFERSMISSRLVLRAGRIKRVHPDGHILCRGACIETTVPVFGGMSGGPAFILPQRQMNDREVEPFGLISHDPDENGIDKNDCSQEGRSIVALLPMTIKEKALDAKEVVFELFDVIAVQNAESEK